MIAKKYNLRVQVGGRLSGEVVVFRPPGTPPEKANFRKLKGAKLQGLR
jgi:hypothetical protein